MPFMVQILLMPAEYSRAPAVCQQVLPLKTIDKASYLEQTSNPPLFDGLRAPESRYIVAFQSQLRERDQQC